MGWTSQQQKAIDSREKNLLVAAAAGSGKTAVLVERITQLAMEEKFDVDKMLIVTFTNAAAQEMRTRIHKAITKLMEETADHELAAKLERQSILLSGAAITTFHSFCLSVIKRHFSKIDLDPKFREGNEHELEILKQEVIEKLFEEKYSAGDEKFNKFTDEFGGTVYGDSELYKIVIELHKFSQSRPYPEKWLKSLVDCYENPQNFFLESGESWLDFIMNFAEEKARELADKIFEKSQDVKNKAAVQNFSDYDLSTKTLQKYRDNWEKIFNIVDAEADFLADIAKSKDDWDEMRVKLSKQFQFVTYPSTKFPENVQEVKDEMRDIRSDYKNNFDELKKLVIASKAEILSEITETAKSVRRLAEITIDFDKAFSAAKRERGIIDFNDMEHLALKIFNEDEHTADFYREKFKVIMVDEYQDTNDVQEEIISKIVNENNFFAVGDVKQSIYRFRNAAPEIFLRKYKDYPNCDNSERIDLSKNFRSRRQVVDAVNAIFRRLMTEEAMEIEYNKDAELNFGAEENYPAGQNTFDEKAEFIIITQEGGQKNFSDDSENLSSEKDFESLNRLEKEIQIVAENINSMIKSGKKVWDSDKKIYRPITFKDIVILLRSTDGKATKIIDVLHANNIPAYAEDKGGYFRAPEIQTMLSLLNILDNSRQDIPLAAVLLSPIGGFSAEDLAKLRIDDRKSDLYTLISNCAEGSEKISIQCREFLQKINRWRELSRQISVPELLSTIYRETGYYDYFNNAAGKIPQANLRVLIDRAAEFESTAFRGLSRFIQFIKKIRDLGNDLSSARILGENEDVVRVMTIHKSKGLEFPVVFVVQIGKQFNFQDLSNSVIAHRNLGIGICKIIEDDSGIKRIPTFARKIIERKMRAESLAEELRVLYVALTRAKEKLILIGTGGKKDNLEKIPENFGSGYIPTSNLQSVNNALTWLMMIKATAEKFIDYKYIDSENIFKVVGEKISADKEVEKKISHAVEKAEISPLASIPAKLSVTEVKRRINEAEEENFAAAPFASQAELFYRRPKFILESAITGAEFGTLMHSVMQRLDLKKNLDAKNISAQIDEMVGKEIFTVEQGEVLKTKSRNIEKFFSSPIGQRILSAKKIYRELPFSQSIDAATIGAVEIFAKASGEKLFIQGIIDLLFQDSAGNWILLDYKTDKNNSDEYFQREYKEQIKFYVSAMETLLNLKISEKYLYLLGAGRLIRMS